MKEPIMSEYSNCFLATFIKDNGDGISAQVQTYGNSAMDVFYGTTLAFQGALLSGDICLCAAAASGNNSYIIGAFDNKGLFIGEGESLIYSRSEAGMQSFVRLYPDGTVQIGNSTAELLNIVDTVFNILENLVTTGSAATQTISSEQKLQVGAARQKLAALLRGN
jgi:hypothetical protein